jgi:hypothetical protein
MMSLPRVKQAFRPWFLDPEQALLGWDKVAGPAYFPEPIPTLLIYGLAFAGAAEAIRFELDFGPWGARVEVIDDEFYQEVVTSEAVEKLPECRHLISLGHEPWRLWKQACIVGHEAFGP